MKAKKVLEGYDERIGGFAGKDTPGGKIKRPEGMPTKTQCDVVVNSSDELEQHSGEEKTIYIDSDIDVTGLYNVNLSNSELVAGFCDPERTENNGRGPVIYQEHYNPPEYDEECARTFVARGGKAPKLWGVSLQGPSSDYFDPRDIVNNDSRQSDNEKDWYTTGLFVYDVEGEFEAIGCEFRDWTLAAVEIGAKGYETEGSFYRCTFHGNNMETYGYGVEQYNGNAEFVLCYFNNNRHAVSGFGYPTESYSIHRCLAGPDTISHVFDMHRLENNLPDGDETAGEKILIENTTIMAAHSDVYGPQEGFGLRGVPTDEARLRNVHFANHSHRPVEINKQGNAYRQEWERWKNFYVSNCIFGDATAKELKTIGAPMTPTDDKDEDDETKPAVTQEDLNKLKRRISKLEENLDRELNQIRTDREKIADILRKKNQR